MRAGPYLFDPPPPPLPSSTEFLSSRNNDLTARHLFAELSTFGTIILWVHQVPPTKQGGRERTPGQFLHLPCFFLGTSCLTYLPVLTIPDDIHV